MVPEGLRCRHAFEYACVHANGEVVCSIIDGRGDFVLGNVHQQSLGDIFSSPRAAELRRLVLSTSVCEVVHRAAGRAAAGRMVAGVTHNGAADEQPS